MLTETIHSLYRFNAWANRRILDAAAQLPPEKLFAETPVCFSSIHATLVHNMSVQWLWLNRWQGRSPLAMLDPRDYPDFSSLHSHWDDLDRQTYEYVFTRSDEDLARTGSYRNFRGEEWSYPLWQMMVHQANHATQHRSEVAVFLSAWGCSPGQMDYLFFVDTEKVD
jgi:uncharacterized damage-inducible protein DinB